MREKCPFCGSGSGEYNQTEHAVIWKCGTRKLTFVPKAEQSDGCKIIQLRSLCDDLAEALTRTDDCMMCNTPDDILIEEHKKNQKLFSRYDAMKKGASDGK